MNAKPDLPATTEPGRRRRGVIVAGLLLALAAYVGVFSAWWGSAKVDTVTYNGKTVNIVQVRYNRFFWHTDPVWFLAFCFMEHVCGYQRGGFAAMEHESVIEFIK